MANITRSFNSKYILETCSFVLVGDADALVQHLVAVNVKHFTFKALLLILN